MSQLWTRHFLRLKVGECGEHVSRNSWDQFVQILSLVVLALVLTGNLTNSTCVHRCMFDDMSTMMAT